MAKRGKEKYENEYKLSDIEGGKKHIATEV